jgi:hypothetical protein
VSRQSPISDARILGIGYNKTGTRSLHRACQLLGIRSLHDAARISRTMLRNERAGAPLLAFLERYEAFFDLGFWAIDLDFECLLHKLDVQYPGSRFILHTRDVESWIESLAQHNRRWNRRRWRRTPRPVDDEWRHAKKAAFRLHDRVVREYFRGRESDLLVFDLGRGDGWSELCPFLERPLPRNEAGRCLPFPYLNRRSDLESAELTRATRLRALLGRALR